MYPARLLVSLTLGMVLMDVAMIALSLVLAYGIRYEGPLFPATPPAQGREAYFPLGIVEALVVPLVFTARGMYRLRRNASRVDELQQVVLGIAIAALLTLGVVAFAYRDFPYSRGVMLISWALAVPIVWLARLFQFWFQGRLRRMGFGEERVLLIGSGEVAAAVLEKLQGAPDWGYRVVGFATGWDTPVARLDGVPRLGSVEDVRAIVDHARATEVIIADPSLSQQQVVDVIRNLDPRRVSIRIFPDVFQLISTQVSISELHGLPLVSVRDAALRGWRFAVKRLVDIVISALVLVLFSPLMLLLALAIKLSDPRAPVFYSQERVGMDGKRFWVIKFRSMRPGAENETGPTWASRNDPRATLLGRFLRRFSLDELPQFINVLIGEMSLVGPRPERPHFVREFAHRIPNYWERHREKAGMTGWAQVNGLRGDTSIEERTAYDLWYVENWNLWLDFKIMLRTIPAMFREHSG